MLNKSNANLIEDINKKFFDKYIINIANQCINYIREAKIKPLNNKNDGTPLSTADLKIDGIIRKSLSAFNSKIKILSEEYAFSSDTYLNDYYWIIDPIDGTKSYISGGDEYTINIALVYKGAPYLGLIAHPPTNKIWYAKNKKLIIINDGVQEYFNNLQSIMQTCPSIIISKEQNSDLKTFLKKFKKIKIKKLSSSLKFCKLAEGKADFYPRFSSISKWDIAAGHAILNATGGELLDFNGHSLKYNNKSSKTGKFLAVANKKTTGEIISIIKSLS